MFTKAITFAVLCLGVGIVGCSGAGVGEPTDNELVPQQSTEGLNAPGVLAESAPVPKDYVFTPGGWTHPSCVHEVPEGAVIDGDHGDMMMDGKVVAHYEPCRYPPKPMTRRSSLTGPASFGGWVEDTFQFAPAGQTFDYASSVITVPPAPSTKTPQTLYYFSGLQSSLDGNCGIIQPVLQWGKSPAGGGSFWGIASWWWSNTNQFHSALSRVNSGDAIFGGMSALGATQGAWNIQAFDQTTRAQQTINLITACRFNLAFPAVFEVDGGSPITTCSQVPSKTVFTQIGLGDGWPSLNFLTYAPTNQIRIGAAQPSCGWAITNGSQTTTLFQ